MTNTSVSESEVMVLRADNARTYRFLVPFMIVAMPFACFALAAAYPDERSFTSEYALLTSVLGFMGRIGVAGGFAIAAGAAASLLIGFLAWNRSQPRVRVWSAITGALLSLTVTFYQYSDIPIQQPQNNTNVFPPAIEAGYRTQWYVLYMLVRYVGFAVLITCLMVALMDWVLHRSRVDDAAPANDADDFALDSRDGSPLRVLGAALTKATLWLRPILTDFRIRGIALTSLIIIVCWLPWMLFMWPANIGPDTVAQLVWWRTGKAWDPSSRQMLDGYAMSDHHPWFDTVLYGLFDDLGRITGIEWLGLYLLSVLQTLFAAVALAVLLTYLCGRLGLSWRIGAAGLALYSLTPIFGRQMMSLVKESTNLPWFILFCVALMEYIRRSSIPSTSDKDAATTTDTSVAHNMRVDGWLIAALLGTALMCSLTRKISFYIVLGALVVTLVFVRKRLITALMAVTLVAANVIIPMVMLPALHAAPGGKQEIIGVTLQQSAYNLIHNGDTMSADDRKTVTDIFSCPIKDIRKNMSLGTVDAAKDCFNRKATTAQLVSYMKVWVKEGVKHPITYLKAVPYMAGPFLMGGIYDEVFFVHWGWEDKGGDKILSQWSSWAKSRPQQDVAPLYIAASKTPGLSLLMSEALYVSWIPLLSIALCAVRRRWRNLLYISPQFFSIAALLVQPSHNFRYTWAVAFTTMVFVALPFIGRSGDRKGND